MTLSITVLSTQYFYAECHKQAHHAECRYAECRCAECHYTECRGARYTSFIQLVQNNTQDKQA
jgi:hypothetical protein